MTVTTITFATTASVRSAKTVSSAKKTEKIKKRGPSRREVQVEVKNNAPNL